MGVFVGSAMWGGCNWGYGDVDINVNRYNNFNRTNVSSNRNINNRWQHDPQHRRGVDYRDSATQQKYGRGSSPEGLQSREEFRGRAYAGRQQISREGAASQRDLSGSQVGTGSGSQYRDLGGGQSRDVGGSTGRSDASARGKSSGAFSGVGNGASTRASSSRGMSSRGGMSRGGGRRR